MAAKRAITDVDAQRTWILFGDPTLFGVPTAGSQGGRRRPTPLAGRRTAPTVARRTARRAMRSARDAAADAAVTAPPRRRTARTATTTGDDGSRRMRPAATAPGGCELSGCDRPAGQKLASWVLGVVDVGRSAGRGPPGRRRCGSRFGRRDS